MLRLFGVYNSSKQSVAWWKVDSHQAHQDICQRVNKRDCHVPSGIVDFWEKSSLE